MFFWIIKIGKTSQKVQAFKDLQNYTISIVNRENHAYLWTLTVPTQLKSRYHIGLLDHIVPYDSLQPIVLPNGPIVDRAQLL